MSTQTTSPTPSNAPTSQGSNTGDIQMDFHTRLNEAVGTVSYRKLGRLTETHPETVRRYMQGQAPSATFLTNLCRVLGISGEWLLTGRGPMKCAQVRSHALSQADPSELMTAVANTLTELCDRMDRLERFMQSLETRVRGTVRGPSGTPKNAASGAKPSKLSPKADTIAQKQSVRMNSEGDHERTQQAIEPKATSAQRIRDAIAKRPS